MATVEQVKALGQGEKIALGNSTYAKRNADGSVSFILRRKVAGKSVDTRLLNVEQITKSVLSEARAAAEAARQDAPKSQPQRAEEVAGSVDALTPKSTLGEVWAHQLADIDSSADSANPFWSQRNRDANVARIKTHCSTWAIWKKPIASLTADDLTPPLLKLRGTTPHQMRKLIGLLNGMFTHADLYISGAKIESPMPLVIKRLSHNHKAAKVEHHPAITDVDQLRTLYQRIVNLTGEASVRNALRLQALTCQRTGEVIGAEWSEFDLDAKVPTWTIPRARMKITDKARKPHVLHLSPQCAEWLRTLPGNNSGPLFPGRSGAPTVTSESCSKAMRVTLDMRDVMVPHGWRSSMATLARRVVSADGSPMFAEVGIEGLLDHLSTDQVKQAYDRGEHHEPIGRVLAWWSDLLTAHKAR